MWVEFQVSSVGLGEAGAGVGSRERRECVGEQHSPFLGYWAAGGCFAGILPFFSNLIFPGHRCSGLTLDQASAS